ncbi:MAG: hypothetical protein ACJ76S_13495 [Solirubrobacteraceae bacterium]
MGRLLPALYLIGRLVAVAAAIVAALIALAIVLHVLGANPRNGIAAVIHDVARTLVGPFDGMFTVRDRRVELAVNWGIAMVVYLIVGWLISRLFTRVGPVEP